MFDERKLIKIETVDEKGQGESGSSVSRQAILKNWDEIRDTANNGLNVTGSYSPEEELEDPEKLKHNRWNREQRVQLVADTTTVVPEKRAEFEIDNIWEQVLSDIKAYRQNDINKYARMAYGVKKIWPEKFSEIDFNDDVRAEIKEKIKEDRINSTNWRVWPNLLIISKELCPEIIEKNELEKDLEELRSVLKVCYNTNWSNYLDALVNLKIIAPEEVAKYLDEKSKENIKKIVSDEKYRYSEKAAKLNIVSGE